MTDQITSAPKAFSFDVGSIWGDAKDLIKFGVAAKYAPQSLNNNQTPSTPSTPSTPENHSTIGDALAPLAAVFAADQAIKRTNKNPPWILYIGLGFVTIGGIAFLYRPVRK